MEHMLFWLGVGIVIGYGWGRFTAGKAVQIIFKQFQDEMHAQYLMLLEQHNIKIKPEFKKKYHHVTKNDNHSGHDHITRNDHNPTV